jgi:hypothetical protein
MKRYRYYSSKFDCTATLSFESGVLVSIEFADKPQTNLITYPVFEEDFVNTCKKFKYKYELLPEDLSFANFWQTYAYKEGSKTKAEAIWNKLSKADKSEALNYIKIYNSSVIKQGIAKAYPTTYLNQRRWDNN